MELRRRTGVLTNDTLQVSETYLAHVPVSASQAEFHLDFGVSDVAVRWLNGPTRVSSYAWKNTGEEEEVKLTYAIGERLETLTGRLIGYESRRGSTTTTLLSADENTTQRITSPSTLLTGNSIGTRIAIVFSPVAEEVEEGESTLLVEYNVPVMGGTWSFRHTLQLQAGLVETHQSASLVSEIILGPINLRFPKRAGNKPPFDSVTLEETRTRRAMCAPPRSGARQSEQVALSNDEAPGTRFSSVHVLKDVSSFPPRRSRIAYKESFRQLEPATFSVFRSYQQSSGIVMAHPVGYVQFSPGSLGPLAIESSLLPEISPGVLVIKEGVHTIASQYITSATQKINVGPVWTITVHNVMAITKTQKITTAGMMTTTACENNMTIKNSAQHSNLLTVLVVQPGMKKVLLWRDVNDLESVEELVPKEDDEPAILLFTVELDAESTNNIRYASLV